MLVDDVCCVEVELDSLVVPRAVEGCVDTETDFGLNEVEPVDLWVETEVACV